MTLQINFNCECELNRCWIYDNPDEDPIGETNFVVPQKLIEDIYKDKYKSEYETIEDFLDVYVPETEGEYIYQKAKEQNCLIEDMGIVLY